MQGVARKVLLFLSRGIWETALCTDGQTEAQTGDEPAPWVSGQS